MKTTTETTVKTISAMEYLQKKAQNEEERKKQEERDKNMEWLRVNGYLRAQQIRNEEEEEEAREKEARKKENEKKKNLQIMRETWHEVEEEKEHQHDEKIKTLDNLKTRLTELEEVIEAYNNMMDYEGLDEEEQEDYEKYMSQYSNTFSEYANTLNEGNNFYNVINDVNSFAELLHMYENSSADDMRTMLPLALAIVQSVLKKTIDPQARNKKNAKKIIDSGCDEGYYFKTSNSGFNPQLLQIKYRVREDMEQLQRFINVTYATLVYNTRGDMKSKITSNSMNEFSKIFTSHQFSDGMDLIQEACASLYAHRIKGFDNLEEEYQTETINKKVWIKKKPTYKTVTTSPIREAFHEVRDTIGRSKAMQSDPQSGYTYIEDLITDSNGAEEVIYKRSKQYELVTEEDYNVIKEDYYKLIDCLNLTEKQREVLDLAIEGYNAPSIATYLGVNRNAIVKRFSQIQAKAVKYWDTDVLKTLVDIEFDNARRQHENNLLKLKVEALDNIKRAKNQEEVNYYKNEFSALREIENEDHDRQLKMLEKMKADIVKKNKTLKSSKEKKNEIKYLHDKFVDLNNKKFIEEDNTRVRKLHAVAECGIALSQLVEDMRREEEEAKKNK